MSVDWREVAERLRTYAREGGEEKLDAGQQASLVAIAERLRVARLATVDRTHFTVVRPNHVEAFDLVAPPA